MAAAVFPSKCTACRAERRRVDRVFVCYPYVTPLREAIQRLKYENRRYLARELAAIAVTALPDDLNVDAILPIPLHPQRQAERGYNQSALLAASVAELLAIPLDDRLLRRERATRSPCAVRPWVCCASSLNASCRWTCKPCVSGPSRTSPC